MKDKLYKMMNWAGIEAIVYGDECNPESILGRHPNGTSTLFQTFIPDAKEVILVIDKNKESKEYIMELADEAGFYAVSVRGNVKDSYHYVVTDVNGEKYICYDPYDYDSKLSEIESYNFSNGLSKNAYEYMGAHSTTINGMDGVIFRVWAPNALRVSVVGKFNKWNGKKYPMIKDEESGIFSLFIPKLTEDIAYKYEISIKGGQVINKLDPFANNCGNESLIIRNNKNYKWTDSAYFESKKNVDYSSQPLNIFEIELTRLLNKRCNIDNKLVDELIAHLIDCSYDYVKLYLNNDEIYSNHRGVKADNIKKLVDNLHKSNIGVLFTWNPSYFRVSDEGMGCYDGTYLYGHLDERKRYNPAFGGYYYNYGRPQIISFLTSYAYFYMNELHFDGFHMEGLSSMLYLDYGKYDGEWVANIYGGHENLEAIDFVKNINSNIHNDYSYAITTTKEEGAFRGVTESVENSGLGFDYIYNNGLSEDFIAFIKGNNALKDMNKLTDNMAYAYSEKYIVSMSKDDVLYANEFNHLKVEEGAGYFELCSDSIDKEALKRATLSYFYVRPGKKLIYNNQDDDISKILSQIYKKEAALYALDESSEGFEWVKVVGLEDGVISFMRHDGDLNDSILVVCNFSESTYDSYRLGVPYEGKYKMIFSSDDERFGGATKLGNKTIETEFDFYDGFENSLKLHIEPMSVNYFNYTPYNEKELLKLADIKVAKYREKLEKEAKERAKALRSKTCKK